MNINKRFKELRKAFGLSQEELGNKIGLSKSGISNIESGTRNVTDKHLKLICSEFPVNEDWLRTGNGKMKRETPHTTMEQLKNEFGFDEFIFNLVYEYLKLNPTQRKTVRNFFYRVIESEDENYLQDTKSKMTTPSNSALDIDIDAEVQNYREELELEVRQAAKSLVCKPEEEKRHA